MKMAKLQDPGRPGFPDAGKGRVNGSRWRGSYDRHGYLDGSASGYDLGTASDRDARAGRHRGEEAGSLAPATPWGYDAEQVGETRMLDGRGTRHNGGVPRDPRLPHGTSTAPWAAEPPARLNDYWSAGYQESPPLSAPPVSYPPAVYQESFRAPVPVASYPPARRHEAPVPAVRQSGAVSRPGERVRGMNAALEVGVAGVGEMAPARQPARPRQMVLAVILAAVGLVAGVLTYKSLASGPVSFGGEVVPTHVYALSFGGAGTVTAVKVHAGDRVTAGEVLATEDGSLAQANLQQARDAEAAAAAALYADQHPQQWSVTRERDAVASAQASLASATTRASSTSSRDSQIISQRQLEVSQDAAALASQCGTATGSTTCQALAAKLATAKQELTLAQDTAAADRTAGQQQEQSAQSQLSERQAALQQVESQAGGVTVTLDVAKQRLAAAKATVAQDKIALKGTSIVAPASGTVGAVSAAAGDSITDSAVHNPVVTVNSGPLIVSAHLPGTEIGNVRTGQSVTLNIESLRASLPGKMVQVNQVASQSQTDVSYIVICRIEAPDTQLMPGMTVSITPQ